jgi:transposase
VEDHDFRIGVAPRRNGGINGPMDGELFLVYVEQCLVPTLKPHDIVVADNLASYKVSGVVEAIEAAGATLRYLPQYSPDLNPIEMPFSNSRPTCASSQAFATPFALSYRPSGGENAPTISDMLAMLPYDRNPL